MSSMVQSDRKLLKSVPYQPGSLIWPLSDGRRVELKHFYVAADRICWTVGSDRKFAVWTQVVIRQGQSLDKGARSVHTQEVSRQEGGGVGLQTSRPRCHTLLIGLSVGRTPFARRMTYVNFLFRLKTCHLLKKHAKRVLGGVMAFFFQIAHLGGLFQI